MVRSLPDRLRPTPTAAFLLLAGVVLVGVVGGAVAADQLTHGPDADSPIDPPTYDPAPPTADGTAVVLAVDGTERGEHDSIAAALDAAEPGDTVELAGVFTATDPIVADTPNVTITAAGADRADIDAGADRADIDAEAAGPDSPARTALVDGDSEGTVLAIEASNVTVEGLWITDSGVDLESEDAGVFVNGSDATIRDLYLTDVAFGIWVDGVDRVTIADSRIEGIDAPRYVDRGNGIHLWRTSDAEIRNTEITATRDGIYYSWAENVVAEGNTMWELRYGVHYMYSDDNRLADNLAFDNDVGYALMVSSGIEVVNNTAVANRGGSGHGILLKEIDDTEIRANTLVGNDQGLFLYNAQRNDVGDNLVYANGVGVHHTAGTDGTLVAGNSFIDNDEQVLTTTRDVVAWNGTDRGNYWSAARTADVSGDGVSDLRHRPAGTAERLVRTQPAIAVFADSPAYDAIRLVESRFPIVESPGIVDHHPLAESPHDVEPYREYAAETDPTVDYEDDPGTHH